MKKRGFLFVMALVISLIGVTGAGAEAYRIGIVTESAEQSSDDRLGAEAFLAKYGEDRVTLAQLPVNFTEERETVIQTITALADDPLIRAVVVNQAVPGTAEAFERIHQARPEVLCLAGEPHENLSVISSAASLVCAADFVSRGYLMVRTAHELGCDNFVHISFPRHMQGGSASRRVAIMQQACLDMGMRFYYETAPDPLEVGKEAAQAYIWNEVPEWIADYGVKTAFFCTNDAHTEPLIEQLLTLGGYFVEADLPSPLLGYPGALGLELTAGDNALEAVEAAIVKQGGVGRFGTWKYSYGATLSAGMAQHAMNVIDGVSQLKSMEDVAKALADFSPEADWNGAVYTDAQTGESISNLMLVYQDTYIMGDPGSYMKSTDVAIPEKYVLED